MSPGSPAVPAGPQLRWRRRGLLWLIYLAIWTVLLLIPIYPSTLASVPGLAPWKFPIAKTLHVTAYAGLAMLSGWVRVPCRFRWVILFLIMVHATVTELLQLGVETRTGSLDDVGLDHLGIMLGLLLTWKWWSDPEPAA
jgi:VanZ family protein